MTTTLSVPKLSDNDAGAIKDCVVCAIRPSILFTRFNIHHSNFGCYHSNPSIRPKFRPLLIYKIINILMSCCFFIGIFNDIHHIDTAHLSPKHALLLVEMLYIVSTAYINSAFLWRTSAKVKEFHGIFSIIAYRFKFGTSTVLTSEATKRIYKLLLIVTLGVLVEEMVVVALVVYYGQQQLNYHSILRIFIDQLIGYSFISFSLWFLQYLVLYEEIISNAFYEFQQTLEGFRVESLNAKKREIMLLKLEKFQRFYMSIRRNYKIIEECMHFTVIIISFIDMCILMIGLVYFMVMFNASDGEIELGVVDIFLILKMLNLSGSFTILSFKMNNILFIGNDVLSYLFKFPISKLSKSESAQVEMLIYTISSLKPEIKASDIFTLGTKLLASVSGTVLTYVLVALQFNAFYGSRARN